jgi:transcriptional regulator with XRE-family HTH domain
VTSAYGATIAKRRLSRRLAELRVESGLTANQVCDKLSWGRGKVGRFEANVWKRPEMSDVRDLLRFYRVPDEERRELEELAMHARERAWWRGLGDFFGGTEFQGYDADASRIRLYMPLLLPGLLQTAAYTEANMRAALKPAAWRIRSQQARRRRQAILERDDGTAPGVIAVITEASLLYRWGSQAERRIQLHHLAEMCGRQHIELRLLRFEDGLHPGMCGLINIFDFPGNEPSTVFVETDFAVQEVHNRDEVDAYIDIFGRAREAALDPQATAAHIRKLMETLE